MIDEYLYEIREDYELLEVLNVSEEEIVMGYGDSWTKTVNDSEYEMFI